MTDVARKAQQARALHAGPGHFISGGCWNAGTARLLAHAGMPLIETSSMGVMSALGLPDAEGLATREIMLGNAAEVAAAVDIPVLADLENGFGDDPAEVAETIRLAGETGIAGGSIEDATGRRDDPIYPFGLAVARIEAAVAAARALPYPFLLTARVDIYMHGHRDLGEAMRRAQAFQRAGADAIMAPGLLDAEELRALVRGLDIPVAALVGAGPGSLNGAQLAALGVRRVGMGGAMVRMALSAFVNAARDMLAGRDVVGLEAALPGSWFNDLFRPR